MKKVLFCATLDVHFKAFHLPYLAWFCEQNWEVHIASNGQMELPFVHRKYVIPIQRSQFHLDNLKAYFALKKIIETNAYDIIHCHTPLGGVLARLAARKARKRGTKVMYTAHGFHFCRDTPRINWFLYYPIEKWLANYTDCLITINEEDYELALRKRLPAQQIEHVHGVGVNVEAYKPIDLWTLIHSRRRHGFELDDFLLFAAAEFNTNKNQSMLIQVMAQLRSLLPKARLLLAGEGPLLEKCKALATELGVERHVYFLGYRNDIAQLLPMCDVAVSASLREGLPVNIMEAMACGLPIVGTHNRGHQELIANDENGFTVPVHDVHLFAERIVTLSRSKALRLRMGAKGVERMNRYSLSAVGQELKSLYTRYGGGDAREQSQYHRAYI